MTMHNRHSIGGSVAPAIVGVSPYMTRLDAYFAIVEGRQPKQFMGIGSTAYVSIEQGRNSVGFELKESYHAMSLKNVEKAMSLFTDSGTKQVQQQLFA